MTRRIVRTLTQVGAFIALVLTVVFLADSRYRILPSNIHSALPTHHAGTVVTDITVAFCSRTNPFSACRLDPEKWLRIEKDLYLHTGWVTSAWLHVSRKKEEELATSDKVVVGVRVGRLDPGVGEAGQDAEKWESRPGGIWVLRSSKRHDSDSDKAVTSVDVLFGADAVEPRPNWSIAQNSLLIDTSRALQVARLSVRHGHPKQDKTRDITPRVRKDGKFKILQISDAHLATGTGHCRDAITENNQPIPDAQCEADVRTLDFLETMLDSETPDLVILSGDQVEGPQSPDTQSTLFKLAAPLIARKIPYAAIFGNHDDESNTVSLSRAAQMSLLQTLPYSLSQPGPEHVSGVGNYHLEILAPSPGHHSALTLYLLDTHAGSPDEHTYPGYDWLKENQIAWFKETAQSLKKEHAKYSHIHLDMAFIHIPLPEFGEHREGLIVKGGDWKEGVMSPKLNTGFWSAMKEMGVVAVGAGHDHANDYCALRKKEEAGDGKGHEGPWMCYAGGSGFGGYGGYGGFHRRVRVWDFDTNAGRLTTWKRVECCGEERERRVGELVVVDGGRVVEGT